MTSDVSFQHLLGQARAGDESAATRIVREFEPELRRYIRFRLTHPGVRRFLDSLDVCQSVLAGFFIQLERGNLEFVNARQLFRLLAVMAENKVRDKVRREQAARRGGGARVADLVGETIEVPASGPSPADVVANRELVLAILDRLPDADRPLIERWLDGDGWAEIAEAVGSTPGAVRKRVNRAVDRAAREIGLIEDST